jgi:hypothetical protein
MMKFDRMPKKRTIPRITGTVGASETAIRL